ncbi:unnamed protein product [Cuscuta campestris]|uniref:Uncharacterized protein n=2 Tax=Cuscuta sect. Cleistogrammica TaxID=1824901 RepID=A0A484K8X6_9ASTE|nr:hypothetical protein DM860_008695 [Cuscuta australis]VFQ58642.1 unnamed protein product [Cuscuta campestris]
MNITGGNTELPAIASPQSPDSDLLHRRPSTRKLSRRKIRSAGAGVRLRKDISGTPAGRRSRPHTPLLRWKFDEDVEVSNGCGAEEECLGRKCHLKTRAPFSARKLAAGIWRLQLPAVPADGENLGFQGGVGHAGTPFYSHRHSKTQDSQVSESLESPRSVSGPRNGTFRKVEPSFHFPNTATMEGATKWDPIRWNAAEGGTKHIHGHQQKAHTSSMVSVLEEELDQARARIQELETEQQSYKKKIEQFLKKVSEERALWRSREHEKIRTILEDLKVELARERKTRQRAEMVNAKLVNELADAKVTAKRYMQEYEKERKTRELIEEVCDELAKEIGEDKAEVEVLKRESAKLRDEVDEERRMLQMAEVWREERVQMKLIDAKVTLEEKYSQMNRLIADLESLLCSKGINNPDMDEIKKFAAAVNVHNIQEFTYEPPNPDDIFSIFEDHMVTEENNSQRHHHTKSYTNQSDGYGGEDGGSEWETVSNVSRSGAGSTPATDISEVCSSPAHPTKKGSSMSRRRCPNGGRHANREWSREDDVSTTNSGDSGNHHINRAMKGCIEWPRNSTQKNSLKSKLLEAKMESQKIQLRHVLKQKI